MFFMDNRNRIIEFEELFHGTINATSVYPRVIVRRALELNASAVIMVHNHPSGCAEPSPSDQAITKHTKNALEMIDVRVLDHIVVGAEQTMSFAESGLM